MSCPYCDFEGARSALHRHLADEHPEKVTTRVDDKSGRRFYEVLCPVCDAPWMREIKPRLRDPRFIEKFEEEIKLVAFDMLLYHIQAEHLLAEAGLEAEPTGEGTP
ncbi:MAG TPA: hypothetical protein VM841_08240 [Actinomycetota bacterium]|nr:hypothetical protein [Actinomycetota bacterium]